MNPLTNVRNVIKMNERELELGYVNTTKSWHRQYKDSAWIFIGGLNFDLTEGDIICAFSQFGEVINIDLIREPKTGKSRGYAFLCYEDQRSTILAVDNLNGQRIAGRIVRVDHVENYKPPKAEGSQNDGLHKWEGCGPEVMMRMQMEQQQQSQQQQQQQPQGSSAPNPVQETADKEKKKKTKKEKRKKEKKEKKEKKKKKEKENSDSESSQSRSQSPPRSSRRSPSPPSGPSEPRHHRERPRDRRNDSPPSEVRRRRSREAERPRRRSRSRSRSRSPARRR